MFSVLLVAEPATAQREEPNEVFKKKTTHTFDDDEIAGGLASRRKSIIDARRNSPLNNFIRPRISFRVELLRSLGRLR